MRNPQNSSIPLQLVLDIYSETDGPVSNDSLYRKVCQHAGIPVEDFDQKRPIGAAGQPHSPLARRVRWHQQTLKHLGIIKTEGRGTWRAVERNKKGLTSLVNSSLLGFSTRLGLAVWGDCRAVLAGINEPLALCLTSPPYLLARPRDYGNPSEADYVDFICACLEPVVRQLVPGGQIALNLGNDSFQTGLPSRSLYREKLTIALCERFGLSKMDELIWKQQTRAPGPVAWASKSRQQLNYQYEPILWLTNDPLKCRSDNRRVLQPHSEKHKKLMAQGGEQRDKVFTNGAHRIRSGKSFSTVTAGKIPKNVLEFSHVDVNQRKYKAAAAALGLPIHGAPMPSGLAEFLIEFMTIEGDVVIDPFSGSCTTARACEKLNRRWLGVELFAQYLRGAAETMKECDGYELNAEFDRFALPHRATGQIYPLARVPM
jgi:site-specific DNA-methyltransferase (cytosine-N4-specific)